MGLRTVVLENEKLRVSLLADKGTEIIEFNFKQKDLDFVWRSPQGLSCLEKMKFSGKDTHMLTDWYTGGWFECFPNVGTPCAYKEALIPQYGELWYLPWEYCAVKDEPEEVILKFFVKTTKMPFRVEKEISLKAQDATLYIRETVENLGRVELDYQWGFHPNFGANFIDDSCVMDMPGADVKVRYSSPRSRFIPDAAGTWPTLAGKDGKPIDLRKVLGENAGTDECIEVNHLEKGITTVTNMKKKVGIELSWDGNALPHNVIWHVTNGDEAYPRYGNTYVLGFLPRNDTVWGLEESAAAGNCPKFQPGERKSMWMNLRVFTL
jgi:galactose mutarotase-like enzyme